MSSESELTVDEHTIAEHRIETEDGIHTLYVQEWGSPNGKPILYMHGGPGGGCDDKSKQYFNYNKHRVIFLDQRGSGQSKPFGSLENNQTDFMVEDIELVRETLKIDSWHVQGASWGTTLALCYGIKYPQRVKSMIILGVFLASKTEIEWITKGQFKNFFPEVYEENVKTHFDYSKKADQKAYLDLILPLLRLDDRKRNLQPNDELDLTPIKIELYYLENNCFIENDYIIKNASKLKMPITIIQGRYDMICPPISAYTISKKLPDCTMHTTLTGHLPSDRESSSVLKAVLDKLE